MFGPAYFLAGDSHPNDSYIADALRARLGACFESWTGQDAILPAGAPDWESYERRADAFDRYRAGRRHERLPVLFGRSSGARVVARHAGRHPAAAVVCIGYPFRSPGREEEPDRYIHLAKIAVPTLVIQGRDDRYGAAGVPSTYRLAPTVRYRLIDGDHELHLSEAAWDEVARAILSFCIATCPTR